MLRVRFAQLGVVSVTKYTGTCLRFVLVYRGVDDTENQRRDFTCSADYTEPPNAGQISFRPSDAVPGDARVLGFQIWNAASALLANGVAELDDVEVAGVRIGGPDPVRMTG